VYSPPAISSYFCRASRSPSRQWNVRRWRKEPLTSFVSYVQAFISSVRRRTNSAVAVPCLLLYCIAYSSSVVQQLTHHHTCKCSPIVTYASLHNKHIETTILFSWVVKTRRYIPTFRGNIWSASSGLKHFTAPVLQPWRKRSYFSETSVSTCQSTWRHNPKEQYRHIHCPQNLKSHTLKWFCMHYKRHLSDS
jgi:hypothetical protein